MPSIIEQFIANYKTLIYTYLKLESIEVKVFMFEKYLFYILLFFLLSCNLETVQFSYIKPPNSKPIVLSENCDYVEESRCLFKFTEEYKVENWTFSPVDIVFILDVSPSTADNFSKISSGFQSLISSIRHLDWRIYFTTADHGDHTYYCTPDKLRKKMVSPGEWKFYCPEGYQEFPQSAVWQDYEGEEPKFGRFMPLQLNKKILNRKFLDSTVPLYEHVFYQTIERDDVNPCLWPPYCQGSHEQPLRVMQSVIERHSQSGVFRDNSQLVFFVVTEEAERKEDQENATTTQDVLRQFSDNFGVRKTDKEMVVYGVSIQSQSCLNKQDTWDTGYSTELNQLVTQTQGMNIDICAEDYSPAFRKISNQLLRGVNEIFLAFPPYSSNTVSIDVEVTDKSGNIIETEWTKNKKENSISFSQVLPEGSNVNLRYYYEKESSRNDLSSIGE